jgi:hypothetical protein
MVTLAKSEVQKMHFTCCDMYIQLHSDIIPRCTCCTFCGYKESILPLHNVFFFAFGLHQQIVSSGVPYVIRNSVQSDT